jgi:hypothetical protein
LAFGAEHALAVVQQLFFSSQHFRPCWQQSDLASLLQQALAGVQQAAPATQQSWACLASVLMPVKNKPQASNEPVNNWANMNHSPMR